MPRQKQQEIEVTTLMQELYDVAEELDIAMKCCEEVGTALVNCSTNTNLTRDIGKFAKGMREFRFLTEEREGLLNIIRRVCTGEISVAEGADEICTYHAILKRTRKMINTD